MTAAAEMPRYRCHKEVWALQITAVDGHRLSLGEGYADITATAAMVARYFPVPGDYLVVYEDGYQSISPQAAFEAGYTRL